MIICNKLMTSQVESISYFIQLQNYISNAIMVKFRGLALHHKKMKITFIFLYTVERYCYDQKIFVELTR